MRGMPRSARFQPIEKWGPLFAPADEDIFKHETFTKLEPNVVEAFKHFHANHKDLEILYLKYARDIQASGKRHFGIKAIAERVRWHMAIERTGTESEDFKINNNFSSCYARLLMLKYPDLVGMFELRSSHGGEGGEV